MSNSYKFLTQNFNYDTLRRTYWKKIDANKEADEDGADLSNIKTDEDEMDGIPYSKVLDLFVLKKDAGRKYKSTDCANFRLRFGRDVQIFSVFFEPAVDYESSPYRIKRIPKSDDGKKFYYLDAVRGARLKILTDSPEKADLQDSFDIDAPNNYGDVNLELQTLIGIFLKKNIVNAATERTAKAVEEYKQWSVYEREAFSAYLNKGVLLASPFVVHLYCWYKEAQKNSSRGEDLYKDFCGRVEKELQASGLEYLIVEAIVSFRLFYKKELAKTGKELLRYSFTFLQNVPPVYPYFGGSKRPSILTAFNSPFFPNALVATSVLQEGVDLHYQCSEVIHYGIAWTQGDNEQRVGRVDRMNGKLEIALTEREDATLPIRYPYLAKTLDESQLIRFANRKFFAEKLIDELKVPNESKDVNLLQSFEGENWSTFFKKPQPKAAVTEPFGVTLADFEGIVPLPMAPNAIHYIAMKQSILKTLSRHFKNELVVYDSHPEWIGAIKHKRSEERDQPVLLKLDYYEPGMFYLGKPVYVLQLKSPLTKRGQHLDDKRSFGRLKQEYEQLPFLKICLDEQNTRSKFKYYVRADLPVICHHDGTMNLSINELILTTKDLIRFTDELEKQILNIDIKNDEVIDDADERIPQGGLLSHDRIPSENYTGWEVDSYRHLLTRGKKMEPQYHSDNYAFNHAEAFIRQISLRTGTEKQVCVYEQDALGDEIKLLEKVLVSSYLKKI